MKMSKKRLFFACLAAASIIFSACSKKVADMKSMEQLRTEAGVPVVTREMKPSVFTTFLKYPAAFMARSESTAKAGISDVVRTIHFGLGAAVKKDDVVISLSLDNPNYQQARANFVNAEATYKRTESLFASNGVSQQSLDNAKTQYDVARAALKAMDDIINIKAPIGGFITRLDVRVTENVQSGAVLFTVSNLDKVEARIWVSAKDIALIESGVPVIAEWLGQTVTGEVSQVNMIMDTEKKAFLVQAEFQNTGRLLTSGMNLDVTLQTYKNDKALYIHRKEMISENGLPFVYILENDTAVKRSVTLGKSQGLLLEITRGLNSGDLLISQGSQLVQEGSKVYAVAPVAGTVKVE